MECIKCGALIPEGEEKCPTCGYSESDEPEISDEIDTFIEIEDRDEEIIEFVVEDVEDEDAEKGEVNVETIDFVKEKPEKKMGKLAKGLILAGSAILLVAITVAICSVVFKNIYKARVVYVSSTQIAAEGNVDKKGKKVNVAELSGYPITLEEYKVFLGGTYIPYASQATEEEWNEIVDGKNTFERMKEDMYKQLMLVYTIAEDARKNGVVATAEDIEDAKTSLFSQTGFEAEKFVKESGTTLEALELAAENLALARVHYQAFNEKVISSFPEEFPQDQIDAKIEEKYLHAKHILFSTLDEERNDLSDEEKAAKKALAEEVLGKLTVANFDEMMIQYSEDPGSQAMPEGYHFTDGEMVPVFENAVKELGINEISGIVESDFGYHIIIRLPLDFDKESDEYDYAKYLVESYLKDDLYEAKLVEMRNEWGFKEYKTVIENIKKY